MVCGLGGSASPGGTGCGGPARRTASGLVPDLLVLCYSSFYFLPILLGVGLLLRRRLDQARTVLVAITFGFAASYLLYLVFPVLMPRRVLEFATPMGEAPSSTGSITSSTAWR